jgi:asparagine synthase (glutamine-hydrolysing)
VFGSEIKSILTCPDVPRELDRVALDQYLTYRYVPSPRTMFEGISKLPPGHRMIYDGNQASIEQYWRPQPAEPWEKSEQETIEELREVLQRAVRRQMISDVPVGAFLSGGLDSSLILALMARETDQPVKTFSIGFSGATGEEDELPFARAIAEGLGAEHHEMIVDPSKYWSQLPMMIRHLEEPNGTASTLAQYSISELASKHVKVALCGQGADELLAGYKRYIGERWSAAYRMLPEVAKTSLMPRFAEWLGHPSLKRAARALPKDNMLQRFAEMYAVFEEDEKTRLYNEDLKSGLGQREALWTPLAYWGADMPRDDALGKMLYMDTRVWLPDELLTYGDKMCMATSLEMRVPFLDVELVEFLERIPSHMKLKGLTGKHILKKAAEAFLPRDVVYRKKQGFPMPILQWFQSDLNQRVAELLLARDSACSRYFNHTYLTDLLAAYRDGRIKDHRKLYCLVSFELWYQLFILTSDVELTV